MVRLSKEAPKNPWTYVWGLWAIGQLKTIFFKALPDLNPYLSQPFKWVVGLAPTKDWPKWFLFSFWFWTYVSMIYLIFVLIRWVRYKWFVQEEYVMPPRVLFHQEMAATIQALEEEKTEEAETRLVVKQLYERIIDRMREIYGLNAGDFRAIAIRPDPNDEKGVIFTNFGFGKTDGLSAQQKSWDEDAAKFMLEEKLTTHTKWIEFKRQRSRGDAETVILIRNIGKLRLGLFVAITKSGVKIEENWSEFEQSTYLATMLGHVDKLVEIVVNYE
jgi:hypothetical protein